MNKLEGRSYYNDEDFCVGQTFLVNVRGWVMLRRVKPGNYRIEVSKRTFFTSLVADFYRPKGKKILFSFLIDDLFLKDWPGDDLNGIYIVKELK